MQGHSQALEVLPPTASPALADLIEHATEYGQAARAPRTRSAYASDWADFETFCHDLDLDSLPADPATVALFFADRASTLRPTTITRRAAAISVVHGENGLTSPTSDPRVRAVLSGIRRTHGTAPRQAAPATLSDIQRMLAHLPSGAIGTRDHAVLLVGFAGGMRRSEIVGLNVGDLAPHDNGLLVSIRRSKTDQEAKGRKVALPYGHDEHTCPVRAVDSWTLVSGITRGPIFRPVDRHGNVISTRLSGQAVSDIIKRAAERAGLDPTQFSGHSLRAGFVTTAALNGASEREIASQTGHRSMESVRRYVRPATAFHDNAVTRLGL